MGKRKLDLWGSFVGWADMYMRDGLHLNGKGATVFADELSAALDSGMGRCLKQNKRSLEYTNNNKMSGKHF